MDRIIQHICEDNVLGKLSDSRYLKLSRQYEKEQVRIDLYFTYVGQIRIPLKIGRESLNESEPA